jgi:hypothetical protein
MNVSQLALYSPSGPRKFAWRSEEHELDLDAAYAMDHWRNALVRDVERRRVRERGRAAASIG